MGYFLMGIGFFLISIGCFSMGIEYANTYAKGTDLKNAIALEYPAKKMNVYLYKRENGEYSAFLFIQGEQLKMWNGSLEPARGREGHGK